MFPGQYQMMKGIIAILLLSFSIIAVLIVPDRVISSIDDELVFDNTDHLAENYLLISNHPSCVETWSNAWSLRSDFGQRSMIAMTQEVNDFFPQLFSTSTDSSSDNKGIQCNAICLDRGIEKARITHIIPERILLSNFKDPNSEEEKRSLTRKFLPWLERTVMQCEIGFINWTPNDAEIYWVPTNGHDPVFVGDLQRKEKNTQWQTTTLGHQFKVIDAITKATLWEGIAEYPSIHVLGQPGATEGIHPMPDIEVAKQVHGTFQHEWSRAHRVKRTFTPLGFNKGKLPPDLWASMKTYYYNNQANLAREEWNDKGVFVNWWEVESFMIGMPWKLKTYWQSRLKTLVQGWAGVDLELTDIYGMRRYEDGARLLTHVDREATHAASLIINIAQIGMREPWLLEIYDFDNRLHEVEMEEGDIVYYESARCLHGRMRALHGTAYVNLFAHYRPINDPEWFHKSNPPGTPEQLHNIESASSEMQILFNQNISPRGQILTGPDTLWKFWKELAAEAEITHGHVPVANYEL